MSTTLSLYMGSLQTGASAVLSTTHQCGQPTGDRQVSSYVLRSGLQLSIINFWLDSWLTLIKKNKIKPVMKEICNFPKLWAPLYLPLALSLIWTLRIRQIPHFFSLKYSITCRSLFPPGVERYISTWSMEGEEVWIVGKHRKFSWKIFKKVNNCPFSPVGRDRSNTKLPWCGTTIRTLTRFKRSILGWSTLPHSRQPMVDSTALAPVWGGRHYSTRPPRSRVVTEASMAHFPSDLLN